MESIMARHLLVSLVFLLLVMDLASPNVVGEKDSLAEKMMNKITYQDVHDKNVRKESLDEVSTLVKGLDKSFSTFNNDVPLLLTINAAKKLAQGKCNLTVPSRNRKRERKSAMRKDYQAYQHGVKDFISDKKWLDAKRSEKCTSCVLDELCKDLSVLGELRIANLPKGERERACKRKILKKAIDIYPIKVYSIQCDWNTTFRTIDGTCNNQENPIFGSVGSKFTRVAEADYGDCISEPRRSVTGKVLPNARDVSRFVHGSNADRSNPNSKILTHLAMNFGQFLDHDITLAEAQGLNCEPPADKKNSECINIHIPKDDAIFREREVDFIEMERDAPHVPVSHCKLVVREHSNTITAFIDASNVYGSTKQVADSLRAPDGLLLDMEHPHGCPFKNLLPAQIQGFCPSRDPNRPCFVTGDIRNNENQGLNSLHTIFTRHHNRIATFFGQKTTWDAEKIYQETRRIIGAQMQIITYGEFLPLILSEHTIKTFGLKLLQGDQFFNGYDKTVDAQMSTAFAVAGYRFGHSLVQELFNRFSQAGFEHKCDKGKSKFLPIPVLDFNNPQYLYDTGKGGIDSILRGLVKDPAGKADGRFSSSVQENLRRGEGDLSDLVAINIKRGRDRGAPGYIIYRNLKLCNLTEVKSFRDLEKKAGFYPKDVANLKKIYKGRIEDIDLFTGGMLEGVDPKGGVLGPTFQCIVAEQFKRLKIGDRFWHENEANAYLNTDKTAFNHCQLRELRKTLFSKIICENSDDFSALPRWAMKQSKIRVSCDALPKLNLEAWIPECESEWNIWQGKR